MRSRVARYFLCSREPDGVTTRTFLDFCYGEAGHLLGEYNHKGKAIQETV